MPSLQVKITTGRIRAVADYAEASALCRAYIDSKGIGNSRWSGGEIYRDGKQVAYVSYNGRVWKGTARGWQPGDRPVYDPRGI